MMAMAFEILLDIQVGNKTVQLMDKIQKEFNGFKENKHCFDRKTQKGLKTENRSRKEHWICKFYEERNDIIHNNKIPNLKWPYNKFFTHLEIADIIFDLVVRIRLDRKKFYQLTEEDKAKCNALEDFLSQDCVSLQRLARDQQRVQLIRQDIKNILKKQKNGQSV